MNRILFRLLQIIGLQVKLPVDALLGLAALTPDVPEIMMMVDSVATKAADGSITLAQILALPIFEQLLMQPPPIIQTYCPECFTTIQLED